MNNDTRTRANLAYMYSFFVMLALGYIIVEHGEEKEILTLIIGIIGGTILGAVLGTYFAASHNSKSPISSDPSSPQTLDVSIQATNTPNTTDETVG